MTVPAIIGRASPVEEPVAGDQRAGSLPTTPYFCATGTGNLIVAGRFGALPDHPFLQVGQAILSDFVDGVFDSFEGGVVVGQLVFEFLR